MRDRLSGRAVALKVFRPDKFFDLAAQCLAPHPALRADLSPRKSGARVRKRLALNSDPPIQTATLPYSRGAKRPRFASPSRTARGDGAVGGARAPMGTLGGGINRPTSRGKAPRAPKARRSASQRSTGHQAIDRSGAPRSGQLSLCPTSGSPLEAPPQWTGHEQDKGGLGDGDRYTFTSS